MRVCCDRTARDRQTSATSDEPGKAPRRVKQPSFATRTSIKMALMSVRPTKASNNKRIRSERNSMSSKKAKGLDSVGKGKESEGDSSGKKGECYDSEGEEGSENGEKKGAGGGVEKPVYILDWSSLKPVLESPYRCGQLAGDAVKPKIERQQVYRRIRAYETWKKSGFVDDKKPQYSRGSGIYLFSRENPTSPTSSYAMRFSSTSFSSSSASASSSSSSSSASSSSSSR